MAIAQHLELGGGQYRGFSLIELMITVAITAIAMAVAVPSFQQTIRTNRVVSLTNELSASLQLARSEAVTRGYPVTVCKSAHPEAADSACDGANWQNGWVVFVEQDSSGSRGSIDTNDLRLRVAQPKTSQFDITASNFANAITYFPTGASNNLGSFTIQDAQDSSYARKIKIARSGRVRVCNPAVDSGCT